MSRKKTLALGLVGASLALGAAAAAPASAHDSENTRGSVRLTAELNALNDSGVEGMAFARVTGGDVLRRVVVQADGLSPDAPHAMHIHYGEQAANECPTFRQDRKKNGGNGDNRLNTAEGVPQYGPIAVSLTTSGDTTPGSALAVDRMPVSKDGHLRYARNNIAITGVTDVDKAELSARHVSDAIRAGEGVVVIHGIDYDEDGKYSLSEQGASELDSTLPAEATDPAACGVLKRH